MNDKYILNKKGNPKLEKDLLKWSEWFKSSGEHRRVASDSIGNVNISTVFLGLDHSFGGDTPVLYETMIFGSHDYADYQERYTTKKDALEGHKRAIKLVIESITNK